MQNQSWSFAHETFISGVVRSLIFFLIDLKQQKTELREIFRPSSEDWSLVLHLAASSETWVSVLYFCNQKWIAEFNLDWNSYGEA